jgi:hypothetical protein
MSLQRWTSGVITSPHDFTAYKIVRSSRRSQWDRTQRNNVLSPLDDQTYYGDGGTERTYYKNHIIFSYFETTPGLMCYVKYEDAVRVSEGINDWFVIQVLISARTKYERGIDTRHNEIISTESLEVLS